VAVTGHTGFKGSWLSLCLKEMGASVHGYALAPETQPALFNQLDLAEGLHHSEGDIRDFDTVRQWMVEVQPEVVFHLAAQPLVRRSYREAHLTWETNVMGTVNLLESLRELKRPCAVVVVTTDKVYENQERAYAYREGDRLGGHDPYSSSKAAVELAVSSWRSSFLQKKNLIRVATARAGNVIGGGDWSEDRILPDLARALAAGNPIPVRNPQAVRPWQHVLEPLSGYLLLAQRLNEQSDPIWQSAFNFGPEAMDFRTVRELVENALQHWAGHWSDLADPHAPHEATLLSLTIEKARQHLQWQPRWHFQKAVQQTVDWYRHVWQNPASAREMCLKQIRSFGCF
jgi:CDP-glucose 4,6-dehydratase